MDAATLYTIVTLLDGREHISRREFASVDVCESARQQFAEKKVRGLPTRYTCERHFRLSPAKETASD